MVPVPISSRQDDSWPSSSSCPRQGRSRLSSYHAYEVSEAGPSNHALRQYYEPIVDKPESDYDPMDSRHMERDPRTSVKKDNSANTMSDPPSSTPSQPVLVRSYSGNAEDITSKPPPMSARRLLSFSSSRNSVSSPPPILPLPTDKDFSMKSILQAIEPDVRGTLDSIAEICGRSKLSLANEYGSHIAPLGEIRAPPGGLVPVEEASTSDERQAEEETVAFDDDTGLVNAGQQDMQPFSFYRSLEVLQQAALGMDRNAGRGLGSSRQRNSTHAALVNATSHLPRYQTPAYSTAAQGTAFQSTSSDRELFVKSVVSGQDSPYLRKTATPAVVSGVHLDAQSDGRHGANTRALHLTATPEQRTSNLSFTLGLLSPLLRRLGKTTPGASSETYSPSQSAEVRLRSMLHS